MSEIFAARFDHIHTNCSDNISMTSYEQLFFEFALKINISHLLRNNQFDNSEGDMICS
jgi:hypothetical protein